MPQGPVPYPCAYGVALIRPSELLKRGHELGGCVGVCEGFWEDVRGIKSNYDQNMSYACTKLRINFILLY